MTLENQIPAAELREIYMKGTLRQRYSIAKQRLSDPAVEPNRVVTAVAALEGFSRAVAVSIAVDRGKAVEVAYQELRWTKPIDLLRLYIIPALGVHEHRLGTEGEWATLEAAVEFRNLLVHEATFLHGGTARQLEQCATAFFERLAELSGVIAPQPEGRPVGKSRFVGIDLAWQSDKNPSGIVVAEGAAVMDVLAVSGPLTGMEEVLSYIDDWLADDIVVAIDAPLIVANPTGQRPCEGEISRRFGRFHASAHTSNLNLYPDPSSVRLAGALEERGFTMAVTPQEARHREGRWFFEVYPHPAHVVLFDLDQIVKYKKGRVDSRREGQMEFGGLLTKLLPRGEPKLNLGNEVNRLLQEDPWTLRGSRLKQREDALDALLCSYLAAHYWYWGEERNEMIGDLDTGNIVVPTVPIRPT